MTDSHKIFLQKLLATFQLEAQEHLPDIVSSIVLLEQAGAQAQKADVERILKKLHTLKGAARAVNLTHLEALCHAMESVFSEVGPGSAVLTAEQFDLLHQAGSHAQLLLQEPKGRIINQATALIARLNRLSEELAAAEHSDGAAPAPEVIEAAPAEYDSGFIAGQIPEPGQADIVRVPSSSLDAIRYQVEALLAVELRMQSHVEDLLTLADDMTQRYLNSQASQPVPVPAGQRGRGRSMETAAVAELPTQQEQRVDASFGLRCRQLADTIGRTRRNFETIRGKLMEATLETALVPFSLALDPLPGLVRNLARSQGKDAMLSVQGGEVQIDRRVLAIIRMALIHLVTNAVDHGIESSEIRLAMGKPAAGVVQVTVSESQGSQITISVTDDGGGIDVFAVMAAALRQDGLLAGQMNALSEQQKLHMALRAGVSTSPALTQVSGRGVGLAIVAEKVASAGGKLNIDNTVGAGCTFHLTLPVRLSTLRGLVVRSGETSYVVPLSGIESVHTLKPGEIESVEGHETLLSGQRVLPVLRLSKLVGTYPSGAPSNPRENAVLLAHAGAHRFALLVDEVVAEQEVLPKDLGSQLRRVRYVAGATLLGDGHLVLILSMDDIARYGIVGADGAIAEARARTAAAQLRRVLVAEDSVTSRLLIKHLLEGAGYEVETAVDGLDALAKFRHADFDALVSDVEMPGMDGLALTAHLRASPKTADLPIILVTSLHKPEEKQRGLEAGADAYVIKGSFDQDNLLETIRRLI